MATSKSTSAAKGTRKGTNGRPKRSASSKSGKSPRRKALAPVQWKCHLDFYAQLRALTFKTDRDMDEAIRLVWTEPMREMPHAIPDGLTMIVPPEAVRFFVASGLEFENTEVLSITELSPKEQYELRKENGFFA